MDTRKAFNKSHSVQKERAYLDNGSDTFGVGGDVWTTRSITNQKVDNLGNDEEDSTKTDVPIVSTVTAVNLPDGKSIIICSNEARIVGKSEILLFSEAHMVENGVHVQQTNDGRKYLDVDVYIIPFTCKGDMMTINIRKPTE